MTFLFITFSKNTNTMESENHAELNRIFIWVNRRSLGTIFLKCLSHIPDSQIVSGIFASCFYDGKDPTSEIPQSTKDKRNRETSTHDFSDFPYVYDGSTCTYSWAKSQLEGDYPSTKILICKDLPSFLSGKHEFIPEGFRHTFLIRHPYRMFQSLKTSSLSSYFPTSNLYEIINTYYKKQFELKEQYHVLKYLQDHPQLADPNPVVIDADDLQNHPASILSQYCEAVGLPFTDDLLRWKPGTDVVKNGRYHGKWLLQVYMGEMGRDSIKRQWRVRSSWQQRNYQSDLNLVLTHYNVPIRRCRTMRSCTVCAQFYLE
ncbi:uncharacterized protein [Amphiura filiformis]|uniref:uncharacterized protein n=1 Tax=Amphiura filiformis TaxID=82378 RepID=UPI003B2231BE